MNYGEPVFSLCWRHSWSSARTQLKPSSQQLLPCFTCNSISTSVTTEFPCRCPQWSDIITPILIKASYTATECHIKLWRKSMQLCQYKEIIHKDCTGYIYKGNSMGGHSENSQGQLHQMRPGCSQSWDGTHSNILRCPVSRLQQPETFQPV